MRLDKYVAQSLQLPRSQSRTLIQKGHVTVNGRVCVRPDTALAAQDAVGVDGAPAGYREFVYLMLNKPVGVISASEGAPGEVTVVDLVRGSYPRRSLFPAGRLDKASTGFVLLTDDGAFAHAILAPRRHVPKTYRVTLDTPLTAAMVQGFAEGVTLADGQRMAPAEVQSISPDQKTVRVVLRQGVYHQIKRMFGVYDAGVNALHREAIGALLLDPALAVGKWREITPEEMEQISIKDC